MTPTSSSLRTADRSRRFSISVRGRPLTVRRDRSAVSLYRLIDEESQRQPVSRLCRTLGVTRSGFYDWQRQPLSDRALANWLLTEQIRGIFDESEQTYGSPRIFKELKLGRGMQVGDKRVARLMRQAGLRSIHAKKQKGSTTRAKEHPLAPDLVSRDFTVDGPDRLWIADFTQLTTWQGTCYIAVVADAYSRLCLGWAARSDKTVDLVLEALDMAIWRRGQMRAAGAIHHSDQGSQRELNRSSQHLVVDLTVNALRAPPQVFSSRASCGVDC